MKKTEFLKGMKMLSTFFNKSFSEEMLVDWYSFFEKENAEDFYKAIKLAVREDKYLPSVSDLLDKIKSVGKERYLQIVDLMIKNGYFHSQVEIDKTYHFIERGIIPSWLKADMEAYETKYLKTGGVKQISN